MSTAATTQPPMYKWQDLPWRAIERKVFKLQRRIYQASRQGKQSVVRRLQKLLLSSWHARCLAVRKVTQENRGKNTPGVDGKLVLSPTQRMRLVSVLKLTPKAQPVRRVWIAKPGTAEKRPLGIPTIENRAQQALAKLTLEPEWEAKFEPNSFGFRPARCTHDAIEAIHNSIKYTPKYVLDADIAKCFDRIDHRALLAKLNTFAKLRRAIKAWLTAGVMDGEKLFPVQTGTPQGGVLSPLLANIALHGLETALRAAFPKHPYINGVQKGYYQPRVIRYADDFVVLHPDLAVIERAKEVAQEWLKEMGLELKPSKTRITHTLAVHDGQVGFDFLGFTARQFAVGKRQYRNAGQGRQVTQKAIIKPSKEAIKRHYAQVADVIDQMHAAPQAALIKRLNPQIKGWANYYATVVAKETYSKLDHLVTKKLLRWARRRHGRTSRYKVVNKYWGRSATGRMWEFQTRDGHRLYWYADVPIKRHVQIAGSRSPYDGDWAFWSLRLKHYPLLSPSSLKLLRRQQGQCAWCKLYFRHGDSLELDHIIPQKQRGRNAYDNLQLLHTHCHDAKSALDGTYGETGSRSTINKDCLREKPCEDESLTHGFADELPERSDSLV